jgi:hypothetical protein
MWFLAASWIRWSSDQLEQDRENPMAHRTIKAAVAVFAAGALTFGFASSASAASSTPVKAPVAGTDSVACISSDLASSIVLNYSSVAKTALDVAIPIAEAAAMLDPSLDEVKLEIPLGFTTLKYKLSIKGAKDLRKALDIQDKTQREAEVHRVLAADLC